LVTIIGNGTRVISDLISTGFISVNFSTQPEISTLYQLGSFNAFEQETTTQTSISVSNYAGASLPLTLSPSTDCSDSAAHMHITIIPAACVASSISIINNVISFVTSYSYSKEINGVGTENWSMQAKPSLIGYTGNIYMLLGTPKGDMLTGLDIVANQGIDIVNSVSRLPGTNDGTGIDASVSAKSQGSYDTKIFGTVTRIGNSTYKDSGKKGSANASIPHQPVYLGA
jgi:hypothetical protein